MIRRRNYRGLMRQSDVDKEFDRLVRRENYRTVKEILQSSPRQPLDPKVTAVWVVALSFCAATWALVWVALSSIFSA